jgi:hypothetical protein
MHRKDTLLYIIFATETAGQRASLNPLLRPAGTGSCRKTGNVFEWDEEGRRFVCMGEITFPDGDAAIDRVHSPRAGG